ncbi:MAG TPA: DUF2795 domain-containing protein [Rhodothermales bacterium]|nr:DUF2795 domain-containing protein [Rhodothermales bacterium]
MPVDVKDSGHYELFETTKNHRILVLDHERWFAWVEGQRGEILVHSDSDHQKDHTLQEGQFYVVDFNDDPKFKDMPHLFLEKGGKYQEIMIPEGLPTEQDAQKKVVKTDDTIGKEELEDYLEHPKPAGEGESRMSRPGGGSAANVAHYLKGIDLPANTSDLVRYARSHDAPEAVIEQLEHIGKGRYDTMADVMKGLGGQDSGGQEAAGR